MFLLIGKHHPLLQPWPYLGFQVYNVIVLLASDFFVTLLKPNKCDSDGIESIIILYSYCLFEQDSWQDSLEQRQNMKMFQAYKMV